MSKIIEDRLDRKIADEEECACVLWVGCPKYGNESCDWSDCGPYFLWLVSILNLDHKHAHNAYNCTRRDTDRGRPG